MEATHSLVIGKDFLSVYAGLCDFSHIACGASAQRSDTSAIGQAQSRRISIPAETAQDCEPNRGYRMPMKPYS
jgi:hypothetical protein